MSAPTTSEEFLDLVRKSGVLDDARLDAFADALEAPTAPQALAQRMVRDGLLTTFQAKQILQGKHRRFIVGGKYKLLEIIGAGGMGAVYLCEHMFMHRLVALKMLPKEKLNEPATVERFYREARAVGQLDHPNIVRAHDIDRDGDLHFLVLEFIDGSSLQEIVTLTGPMDPVRAAHYVAQAARGLEHAHAAGLIHRDIKPGNLLLDRGGTVKVLDLGLARFFNAPHGDSVTARYDEGTILGTADYLAPEQGLPGPVDVRADIYSLGATLYFLLTGKAPFEEGTIAQKMLWHQARNPKPVADYRTDVPAGLLAVLDKMMAKRAGDRYRVPSEVAEALKPWTDTPIPPPPEREMPRRTRASQAPGTQSLPSVPVSPAPRPSRPEPGSRPKSRPPDPADTPGYMASETTPLPRPKSRPPVPADPEPAAVPPRRGLWIAGVGAVVVAGAAVATWAAWPRETRPPVAKASPPVVAPVPPKEEPSEPLAPMPEAPPLVDATTAAQHVGQRRTVKMVVNNVGSDRTNSKFFLNSEKDRHSSSNFVVVVPQELLQALRVDGRDGLEDRYKGRTVHVTGIIGKYQNLCQIWLEGASDLVRPEDNTP